MNPSISETLHLWGQGAVTLPKRWREQFDTKIFIAESTPEGLLIKPLMDIDYYERDDGSFGLKFPMGIEAEKLLDMMNNAEKSKKPKKRSARRRHG